MMVNEYNDPGCRLRNVLDLAGFLARSEVNGPGSRAVVWVQGCPHRCDGCFNPQFQAFSSSQQVPVDNLAETILSISGIDGVTFSGGEPFSQAVPLAALGRQVRDAGLSVITYSGYTYDHLLRGTDSGWQDLLAVTDLLVAGPYISSLRCTDPLKGSSNQQIIPLSGKITVPARAENTLYTRAEFTIAANGSITTTGFPDRTFILTLTDLGREA